MKKLKNLKSILLIAFVLIFITCKKDTDMEMEVDTIIYTDDLTLSTQAHIDAFIYTEVTGDLIIDESSSNSITNLDGLTSLTTVGADLNINDNTTLKTLSGLENLTAVGGNLSIQNNLILNNFCAIGQLTISGEIARSEYDVRFNRYNPTYSDTQRVITCEKTLYSGDLTLRTQQKIDAFTYATVTGNLTIEESSVNSITNLDGLISLATLFGNLNINNNAALRTLSGLDNLSAVGGNLTIENNATLVSFCTIRQLAIINEITSSQYNVSSNMHNPTHMEVQSETTCVPTSIYTENLTLSTQRQIDDFTYTEIIGDLVINDSSDNLITNLNGLSSLTTLGGHLLVYENNALTSLSGLDNLTTIVGDLSISDNPVLTSLSGLDGLTAVGRNLNIYSNLTLSSLSGLDNLVRLSRKIYIGRTPNGISSPNPLLTNLCAISQLITNDQVTDSEYFVINNAYNPTYSEIQNTGSGGCKQ